MLGTSSTGAFGQPANSFGQPANSFGQPANSFGAPKEPFGSNTFGSSQQGQFGTPNSTFGGRNRPVSQVIPGGSTGWDQTGAPKRGQQPTQEVDDDDPFAPKVQLFGQEEEPSFTAATTKGPFSLESAINDTDVFHDLLFKIVIIGNSGVGKTGLLGRWMKNKFEGTSATISVEFSTKTFMVDGKVVKVQMWDTAGQEQFRALTQSFYRNANGAILVYDVTNVESFRKLESWLKPVQEAAGNDDVQIMLVGNKIDQDMKRKVSTQQGLSWAKENGLSFLETSALTGDNVHRAFQILLQDIFALTKRLNPNTTGKPTSSSFAPPPALGQLGAGGGIQVVSNNEPQDVGSCCMDIIMGEDSDTD